MRMAVSACVNKRREKKMKKVFIPLILYAYLAIRGLGQLGSNLQNMFACLRTLNILGMLSSLLALVGILVPVFALLATLVAAGIIKNEKLAENLRKWMIPLCFVMAVSQILALIRVIRSFLMMGFSMDFYGIVSGGLVSGILAYMTSLVLYFAVAGMIQKQPAMISKKYRFGFYGVLFVMIFFGMLALIGGANVFGGLVSLLGVWFLPVVFVKAENADGVIKEATIAVVAIAVIMLISYLASDAGGSSGGSSSGLSGEPWKELGVSEKEYMEIYNHFKYGTKIGN